MKCNINTMKIPICYNYTLDIPTFVLLFELFYIFLCVGMFFIITFTLLSYFCLNINKYKTLLE